MAVSSANMAYSKLSVDDLKMVNRLFMKVVDRDTLLLSNLNQLVCHKVTPHLELLSGVDGPTIDVGKVRTTTALAGTTTTMMRKEEAKSNWS